MSHQATWSDDVKRIVATNLEGFLENLEQENVTELEIALKAAEMAGRSPDWDQGFHDGIEFVIDQLRELLS